MAMKKGVWKDLSGIAGGMSAGMDPDDDTGGSAAGAAVGSVAGSLLKKKFGDDDPVSGAAKSVLGSAGSDAADGGLRGLLKKL